LSIRYFSDGIKFNLKNKRKITNWLKNIAITEKKEIINLSYIFVDNKQILDINQKYLNHNYYTDIITFDNSLSDSKIAGEMYISFDTVKQNAIDYNVEFNTELLTVMVHGLLHLCGYNDNNLKQRKIMQKKQTEYLTCFIKKDD